MRGTEARWTRERQDSKGESETGVLAGGQKRSAKVQIGAELLCKGERDEGRGVRPARPRYNKDSTHCP